MDILDIEALRDAVWEQHPIITERAILPTSMLKDAIARVWNLARKGRGSIGFFAEPLTGKSFCAEALAVEMRRKIPGCGVVILEVVEDKKQAEGRLLSEILNQIDYAPTIARDLAGKRTQVHRALLALAGEARHLFLIFDEAQELSCVEFAWLKSVINRLVRDKIKVTVVLFGQRELTERRKELMKARSDLERRFMSTMIELRNLSNVEELKTLLVVVDTKSEFPAGSGLTYTQLLLPRFFANGGRLARHTPAIFKQLKEYRIPGSRVSVSMSVVATFLASLFLHLRAEDAGELEITPEVLAQVRLM